MAKTYNTKVFDAKEYIKEFPQRTEQRLFATVIYDSSDEGSAQYVRMKNKKAEADNIELIPFDVAKEGVTFEEVKNLIKTYNNAMLKNIEEGVFNSTNGMMMMIQLPLVKFQDRQDELVNMIDPRLDIDGMTHANLGRLAANDGILYDEFEQQLLFDSIKYRAQRSFVSATPKAVIEILQSFIEDEEDRKFVIETEGGSVEDADIFTPEGKHAVVIGRSRLLGQPVANLLQNLGFTVTIVHSRTPKALKNALTESADVIVLATGVHGILSPDHVKPGVVIIDAGISFDEETGKTVGDVNYKDFLGIARFITPVPNGVGPMTIHELLGNIISTFEKVDDADI